jgi:hypothetical protein
MQAQAQWAQQQQQQQQQQQHAAVPPMHPAQMQAHVTAKINQVIASHVTRHTSHLARHTSHVTRHTSHVTRHTSHVTRHTSQLRRHTSQLRRHTSQLRRHTSHVTRHTSHITRHTSHVTRHTSHVTRHTSHVTLHTSHVLMTSLQIIYAHQLFPLVPPEKVLVLALRSYTLPLHNSLLYLSLSPPVDHMFHFQVIHNPAGCSMHCQRLCTGITLYPAAFKLLLFQH